MDCALSLHIRGITNECQRLKKINLKVFGLRNWLELQKNKTDRLDHAVNKAARLVLNHSLENKMGNVVFGWNKGRRQEINLGSKTNQIFVQIPTARLKDRISQLCERHGIRFIETEESYTTKASFLDADELPTFGAKPEGWKKSGRRVISIPVAPELLLTVDC